jgi:methyl-accepting chemotaxis protein
MKSTPLTVRQQLTFAFGGLALACALVAAMAVYALNQANDRFHGYVEGINLRSQTVARLGHAMKDRAIAARNLVLSAEPSEQQVYAAAAGQAHQRVLELLKKYNQLVDKATDMDGRAQALSQQINQVETAYAPVALAIVAMASKGEHESAVAKMHAECVPLLLQLNKLLAEYSDVIDGAARDRIEAAYSDLKVQRLSLLGLAALAMAGAIGLGWRITHRLTIALGAEPAALSQALGRIADGDLGPVPSGHLAPTGSVMASAVRMQGSLVQLIGQVRQSADSIATASGQIATGNQDLSGRTELQASALQQTTAQMQRMTETVQTSAVGARQASELALSAAQVAEQGGAAVQRVVATMGGINDASRRIVDIIGVIDGIAFQTNILALNAAVEAARAGDQGRGFAVVAGEVRTLASRSADAAKEIKALIDTSVSRVTSGTSQVNEAGSTMQAIVDQVRRVTQLIGEIHTATDAQTLGIGEVNQAVASLEQGTQQNAALVEQSAAAADSLNQQAREMTRLVATFRLEGQAALA